MKKQTRWSQTVDGGGDGDSLYIMFKSETEASAMSVVVWKFSIE